MIEFSVKPFLDTIVSTMPVVDFTELSEHDGSKKTARCELEAMMIEIIIETAKDCNVRFCKDGGAVYLYNGAYWQMTEKKLLCKFLSDAAQKMGHNYFQSKHYEFKERLFLQFMSEIDDRPPMTGRTRALVNLLNGTFEITLDSQHLREPAAEDFLKYQLGFEYDPTAQAPMFEAYLNRVLPDKDCQNVLSEYLGYVFVKELKLEKVLILYGSGANGKSVFFEIVNAVLGRENVSSYSLQELTKENSYQRAALQDVLLNYSSEINGKLEASVFKQLASSEPVSARRIYGQPFTMTDYCRLIFNCNELPREIEQTDAFFRRFIVIPFEQTIPKEEQDHDLAKKIIEGELSGVFNWILQGLHRLLANRRFTDSERVRQQIEQFRLESDSVAMFLDEENYMPSMENKKKLSLLYEEYGRYCGCNGLRKVSNKTFPQRLRSLGYVLQRYAEGNYVFVEKSVIYKRVEDAPGVFHQKTIDVLNNKP